LLTLVALGAPKPANAAIVQAFTRAAISPNTLLDWGQLGPEFTSVPNPSPVSAPAAGPMTVSGTGGGSMERLDEGSGWNGIFSPGERLLFSSGANQPMILDFSNPVNGVAFGIQENFFGNYTGTLNVYAADDTTLLGTFNVAGNNTGGSTGLAPIIGAFDDTGAFTIGRIDWSTTQVGDGTAGVSVNQVSLNATPEPGTLALSGLGMLGLIGYLRRRKQQKA
jgi:hypothetical protein